MSLWHCPKCGGIFPNGDYHCPVCRVAMTFVERIGNEEPVAMTSTPAGSARIRDVLEELVVKISDQCELESGLTFCDGCGMKIARAAFDLGQAEAVQRAEDAEAQLRQVQDDVLSAKDAATENERAWQAEKHKLALAEGRLRAVPMPTHFNHRSYGAKQNGHDWGDSMETGVVIDTAPPLYHRVCQICGLVQQCQEGGDWQDDLPDTLGRFRQSMLVALRTAPEAP